MSAFAEAIKLCCRVRDGMPHQGFEWYGAQQCIMALRAAAPSEPQVRDGPAPMAGAQAPCETLQVATGPARDSTEALKGPDEGRAPMANVNDTQPASLPPVEETIAALHQHVRWMREPVVDERVREVLAPAALAMDEAAALLSSQEALLREARDVIRGDVERLQALSEDKARLERQLDNALTAYEHAQKDLHKSRVERDAHAALHKQGVWYWQGDGNDHPESLACPILITADSMRAVLAAVRAEGPDAERFRSLSSWVAAIIWKPEAKLPTLGKLEEGFDLDDLRAWLDGANK